MSSTALILVAISCSPSEFTGVKAPINPTPTKTPTPLAPRPVQKESSTVLRPQVLDAGSTMPDKTGDQGSKVNSQAQPGAATPPQSAAPVPAPVAPQQPVVTPPVPSALVGEWRGLCAHAEGNSTNPCTTETVAPMLSNGVCPDGLERMNVGARYAIGDNDARNEIWTSACVRRGTPSAEQQANPSLFARAGGIYGLCVYTNDTSGACDREVRFPMNANQTCPAGFRFVHLGSRYAVNNGTSALNEAWYGACMAVADGPQVVMQTGGWTGVCGYTYNQNACNVASVGISQRRVCPAGTTWHSYIARYNGLNETWAGTCMR